MFWENGNQPILVEFRGCFPHAEVLQKQSKVFLKAINKSEDKIEL